MWLFELTIFECQSEESGGLTRPVRLMNYFIRSAIAGIVVTILSSPVACPAGSQLHSLNEDAALDLLRRTLKRDRVYEKRIPWDCISYGTEETTNVYFEFVLREIHNAKCGGDPETSPAIDRYRIYRSSRKIAQWEAAQDKWGPYKSAQTR